MTALGKHSRSSTLTILGTILTALCTALPSYADNLVDILKAAELNDANIRAAYAEYRATRQNSHISRSYLLPNISGSAYDTSGTSNSYSFDPNIGGFTNDERDTAREGWSITLSQVIYDHSRWVNLKRANLEAAQAEENYKNARQDLIIRVSEAYFSVLASQDLVAFAKAQKKSVSQQLEQTKQRYEVGLIAITDVKESQASYDLAVADEIQARNRLDTSQEALRTITNKFSDSISALKDNLPLASPEPNDIEKWVDTSLQQNAQLKSARFSAEIAHKDVSRLRAGHYPTLSLSATKDETTVIGGPFGDETSEGDSLTIRLDVPIFSGWGIRSSVKQAIYREDAANERFEFQKRSTKQQTRNFYRTVIADISRVKALKQALTSTQAAYEATNAGFEVGTRNSAEVLVALRETFRAKQNYSQARYDYILNTLRLKKSAGTLNLSDIQAINRWLN